MAGYGVKSFFDKYYIVAPIQSKEVKLIKTTPTPTKKPKQAVRVIEEVYAQEVENPYDEGTPKNYAWEKIEEEWSTDEWEAYEQLVQNESGWRSDAVNPTSGACGIPQALPCSKMGVELADYEGQIDWMIGYIIEKYDNPTKALAFWGCIGKCTNNYATVIKEKTWY